MKRLQNLSYKTLFTILFFSLAGIVFFLKIGGKTQKVSAAWWDEMWHYRKAISITNSSGSNLTDFQVSVSIGTSQLIADGKMQTDCDDIRITDINGNLLPYWIEENNPGCNQLTDTKVWLKANSLPTSGSTIYVYYGNSSASNNENGDNVFDFFDDFNDAIKTQSNWTATGTGYTVAGGNLYHSTTLEPSNSFATYTINNSSGFTNGIIESRMKPASCGSSYGKGIIARYSNDNNEYIAGLEAWTGNYNHIGRRVGGAWTNIDQDSLVCSTSTWYQFKWTLNGTNQFLSVNGVASSGVDSSFSSGKIGVHVDNKETPTGAYWDYIFVHKYASSEPTVSTQSEESGGGPIAYWKFDEGVGTTVYDSAGNFNGVFGTGSSAPTWANESQCISGKCLSFDGTNDYIDLTNLTSSGTTYTFSFWVYSRDSTTGGKYFFDIASGRILFGWGSDTAGKIGLYDSSWRLFGNSPSANTWHHVEFILNGSTSIAKMYLDGSQYGSDLSFTPNPIGGSVSIGSRFSKNGYFFNGLIDEVKIYPYARTAAQIKLDYNSRGSLSGSSVNLGVRSNTAPSLKSGLVGYWKFDENNGNSVYDSSGNNITGTFVGTTQPTWQNGKYKSGIGFSGVNDSISLPYQPNFRNAFSVSIWFKRTTDYNQTTDVMLLSPPNAWYFYDSYNSGAIRGDVYIDGTRRAGINVPIPFDGNWYHVVYTYDSATHIAKMYKNGKVYQSIDLTSLGLSNYLIDAATGNLSNLGWNNKGRGVIVDEAKIYNRALTDQEVLQGYNQSSAIQFGATNQTVGGTTTSLDYCIPGDTTYCAAPVAEWKMDEGVGSSAVDTSGNNNTGTISGATWTQGKIGKSLNFNGTNDYVSIPTYSYTTNTTISVWVKGSYINGSQIIVGSPNSISLGIYNVGSSKGIIGFSGTSKAVGIANNFVNNDWNHLTVVLDSSGNATYYCNGQLLSNSGTNYWIWSSGTYIGRRDSGNYFKGQIDHIKIYDYARTPAQIAYDYNKGGPVGWWKFDECQGSTAYDWSGNANHGTINIGSGGSQNSLGTCAVGTSAAWTNGSSGKINSSLNFDGTDDYIDTSNQILKDNSPFTYSAWIKFSSSQTGKTIMGRHTNATGGAGMGIDDSSANKIKFHLNSYSTQRINSTMTLNDNNWHCITGTWDGANLKLYIDGNLNASNTPSTTLTFPSVNTQIGRWVGGSSQYFSGQIDDVRIYNYALTSEQIKNIYNGGAVNFQ